MSLVARVRHYLSYGSFKHICSPRRQFARLATLEEHVEIDQRMLPTDYDPANFDPTEHRSPPTERVWRLVDEVTELTLVEAAELSNVMMERFCTTMTNKLSFKERYVIMLTRPPDVAATKKDEKPEKMAFELKMESFEAVSKLKVIKEIRSFTDLGLKEAKELVEKAPTILKKGVLKEEAEQIIEKMKAIGAKVVMV